MLFRWLRNRRRRRLLETPFPERWLPWLENLPFYRLLDPAERSRLHDVLRVIVAEKNWEGAGGLALDEEKRVVIAAQAALLVLEIEHDHFHRAKSIIVYPSIFDAGFPRPVGGGIVSEGGAAHAGQAWYRGPVVLAWDAVRNGAADPKDGRNLVFHEFAHKLDMLDGFVDGTPPLHHREAYAAWRRIMTEEYERLRDGAKRGRRSILDRYGATNEGEFFAVATETFFEKPIALSRKHPELYACLRAYYRQDPLERLRRAQRAASDEEAGR